MGKFIARAIDLVNKQLTLSSRDRSEDFVLNRIRNGLNQLLQPNLLETNQVRLFCRQMNRLMDYNDSISSEVWAEWHDDIDCIINGQNSFQLKSDSWKRFLDKMKFEEKLEDYESEFQKKFGKRKTLNEFLCEYEIFFQNYLGKCLSFHSKIQIQGLVGNIDDFCDKFYQITDVLLTPEKRKSLQEKLQYIEIDLDCSNKSLQCYEFDSPTNNNLNTFLPSTKQRQTSEGRSFEKIQNILQYNRWVVILGDPGSSKTTLLRWITRFFAEKALHNDEESIRIPILIRIGEFAAWLIHNPTKTLIDYIGEHSWFSKHYCQDDDEKNVLKQLINHGHALVLLDGLDEILDIGQRGQIVNLIRDFIEEYVRASDFTSAFDNRMIRKHIYLHFPPTIETPLPSKSNGNQIIITGRFVGYQSDPFISSFIKHYSLLSMKPDEAKEFVEKWMILVEEKVFDIFQYETIELNKEIREDLLEKRIHNIKSMFENKSTLLISNPSLLSLICTFIFRSSHQLHLQSRAELYDHTIQTSFSLWKNHQLNIPEDLFTKFLVNLATYLHLNSPSGLIDIFDLKLLSSLTFQQYGLSNNRQQLRDNADQLIKTLENNIAFVFERGLQVYSFQHLSFQEYFVAQALINDGSIEQIIKRILSFSIDFRFHESLLLSIGLISFKWSFHDYNQFCHDLISSTENNSIPFGTLLLFNSFNDMKILPSNSILMLALNNLFHHSSMIIGSTYLLWNLFQLSDQIILEWMQSNINDNQSIFKFCQCLFRKYPKTKKDIQKLPSIVYQQLWSLHTKSPSIEFYIDQVLRHAMIRDNINEQIFNKDFSSHLLSNDIHPLILSVIIAVCGGVYYQSEKGLLSISFSTKHMHRESLIFIPMIDYFNDNNQSHSRKISILIDYYQNILDNSLSSDTSTIIVDTFIAFICLQGLSQISIYEKYQKYQALPLALDRFKWNWLHFMISSLLLHYDIRFSKNVSFIKSELQTILVMFSSQSNEEQKSFLSACISALMKVRAFNMRELFDISNIYSNQIDAEDSLIHYLPQSLRKLYLYRTDSLPLIVFLFECLKQLNDTRDDDPIHKDGLIKLKPLLMKYSLENYALAMFQERYSDVKSFIDDTFSIQQSFDWEILVHKERQRIYDYVKKIDNEEKDLRLFAASISLARICQSKYHLYDLNIQRQKILSFPENESICFAIKNICNPILRILACNFILNINDPFIFNQEQRDEFRNEIIALFYSLLPNLSLLTSTFLFIQCYNQRRFFPFVFQNISILIGEKLIHTSENRQIEEQQAAFIALRQLNNRHLAFYLSKFAKQINNHLSDLLHFNSTIFHNYFLSRNIFQSCNITLLSMMFLIELTFDVQNLQIYIEQNDYHEKQISLEKQFKQLWNESSEWNHIMTFTLAKWITNHLTIFTDENLSVITKYLSRCISIEQEAIPLINNWIYHRTNKDFSQYAAIELLIYGSDNPYLIDILKEIFLTKNYSRLISVADRLFKSPFIHLNMIERILIELKDNIHLISKISISINRQDIFQLILHLQFQQFIISNNISQENDISIQPLVLIMKSYSKNLQIYLLEYLRRFLNELILCKDFIKEEHISFLIQWIIERLIRVEKKDDLFEDLYRFIFALIPNRQFVRIGKSIINGIDQIFYYNKKFDIDIYMQDYILINIEKIISSWNIYSIDILAIALLSYGNCLLRLQLTKKNYKMSDKIKRSLKNICKQFFPQIIFIRANFCLIFSQDLNQIGTAGLNSFKKIYNVTPEMEYQILVQNTLYRAPNIHYGLGEFVEHFNTYPQTIEMFVIDLYDYLDNKNNKKYIHYRIPDYIRITHFISEKHSKIFCDAVRKSSFGEEKFKTKLYNHSTNYPNDRKTSISIYISFGIITAEFLDMLDLFEGDISLNFLNSFKNLKQISDRDAIENLFNLLNRKRYSPIFNDLLSILKVFVKANVISSLEVHQKLPLVINSSYESSFQWRRQEEHILNFLLDISSFTNDKVMLSVQTILTTENMIDTEFNIQIDHFNKTLNLACGGRSPVGFVFPKPIIQ